MASFATRYLVALGFLFRRIGIAISGAEADEASAPTLTAGSGAPSASEPNGSRYYRTNGYEYRRIGGAWELVDGASGNLSANTISELTAASGVTVDGVLLKDGVNRGTTYASNVFLSAEVTGNGSSQDTAHGLGATPVLVFAIPSDLSGGACTVAYGTHDATNVKVTVTTGEKYRVVAFK